MKDILIAHRGEPETWPENSLTGYREVLKAGAQYIETDVQISADGIPILSHDPSLLKITDQNRRVTETPCDRILSLPAGYPDRFGSRFSDFRIATLAEFAELLVQWPDTRAFVEIKHASIHAFGVDRVIDIMLTSLSAVHEQCVLISFEYAALKRSRTCSSLPIGWVLPAWSDETQQLAERLAPDYLFVNTKRVPPLSESLWRGPWQWVVYTINDENRIVSSIDRGFDLVETNIIRELLATPGNNV